MVQVIVEVACSDTIQSSLYPDAPRPSKIIPAPLSSIRDICLNQNQRHLSNNKQVDLTNNK